MKRKHTLDEKLFDPAFQWLLVFLFCYCKSWRGHEPVSHANQVYIFRARNFNCVYAVQFNSISENWFEIQIVKKKKKTNPAYSIQSAH